MRTLSRDRKIRPDEVLAPEGGFAQSEWVEPAIELENLFKEIAGFVALAIEAAAVLVVS
jgi:hypothetical protein